MFVVEEGSTLTATIGESCASGKPYEVLVKAPKLELKRGEAPGRAGGSVLPLFVASPR